MKYIPLNHVYPKDIRTMSILAKSGAMDRDTFHKLEITDNRIKSYLHAGLIKETSVVDKNGNGIRTYFELGNKGKDFCRQECHTKHFISNANASSHNAKVSEYLVNNLSKKELDSCLSERELLPFIEDRLQEYLDKQEQNHYQALVEALQNNQLSMPDIIYKTEQGTWEAIEITTDSYGNEEIETKTMTCELLSVEVTFVHT